MPDPDAPTTSGQPLDANALLRELGGVIETFRHDGTLERRIVIVAPDADYSDATLTILNNLGPLLKALGNEQETSPAPEAITPKPDATYEFYGEYKGVDGLKRASFQSRGDFPLVIDGPNFPSLIVGKRYRITVTPMPEDS